MRNFIFAVIILVLLGAFILYSAYTVRGFADEVLAFLEEGDAQGAYILYMERKGVLALSVNGNEVRLLHEALCRCLDGDSAAFLQAKAICRDIKEKETLCAFW